MLPSFATTHTKTEFFPSNFSYRSYHYFSFSFTIRRKNSYKIIFRGKAGVGQHKCSIFCTKSALLSPFGKVSTVLHFYNFSYLHFPDASNSLALTNCGETGSTVLLIHTHTRIVPFPPNVYETKPQIKR